MTALLLAIALGLAAVAWWWAQPTAPETLRLSAGDRASEAYDFAEALAALVDRRDLGFTIDVVESAGADANAAAIAAGRADLAMIASDTVTPPEVAAVAAIFPQVFHLVARDDAAIRSPADLAGKAIGVMPWGSGSASLFLRIAEHYGFAAEALDLRPMSPVLAETALVNGRLDALVRVVALGNAPMRSLLAREEVSLVGIDQAAAIEMFAPAVERVVIPRGALNGRPPTPPADLEVLSVRAVLVAAAALDPAIVERLTALLFEARNELVALDEQAALMASDGGLGDGGFAVHPGARRHYDADKPFFVVEYAEPMALGLSAAVLALSGLWQLRRWYEARRKNRGDVYNGEIARLVAAMRAVDDAAALGRIEDELYAVFHRVLKDLDEDRLAAETLPTFDFAWRSATELLARRRLELAAPARREVVTIPA